MNRIDGVIVARLRLQGDPQTRDDLHIPVPEIIRQV